MLSSLWNFANLLVLVLFFGSIPLMIKILGGTNYYWDYAVSQFRDDTLQVYDFIVVGAGSAGSVVANRLSKNNKVLLLEAGGNPLFYNSIPMLANDMLHQPQVDWMYKTVPQKFSGKAVVNQQFPWPRGKLLGGTSNLNYQVYMRGNPNCYDNWANITGDSTWKYDNVLPYFKKSLDYHGEFSKNEKHYGQSAYGFLHVENRKWKLPMHKYFVEGGKELGYPEVDVNGPQKIGFGPIEVTQKNGERFGTYVGFLKNFLHRSNLRVSRYSHATKIKLDKSGRSVGVWYSQHGVKKFARVSKEVIVSSGAIGSPQLLMLSGIGPKKHLESVGIKPKLDLPVGHNLQDHPTVMVTPVSIEKPLSVLPERDLGIKSLTDYFFQGFGHLTMPLFVHSVGYMSTSYATKDWPDLQIYIASAGIYENIEADFARGFGYDENILKKYFAPAKSQGARDGIILFPVLNRPKSIGQITLKDKNPFSHPLMDPRYLEHPEDVAALIEGVKFCLKLVEKTKAFQSVGAKFWDTPFPGCEKHALRSDAYFECFIRHFGMHVWHPAGTCRMGSGPGDKKAVVDSKLRVLKTKGLRVADASIMPQIVNGNTNAPSIMIGEKAADFIREYWSEQYQVCDAWQGVFKGKEAQCFYSKIV